MRFVPSRSSSLILIKAKLRKILLKNAVKINK